MGTCSSAKFYLCLCIGGGREVAFSNQLFVPGMYVKQYHSTSIIENSFDGTVISMLTLILVAPFQDRVSGDVSRASIVKIEGHTVHSILANTHNNSLPRVGLSSPRVFPMQVRRSNASEPVACRGMSWERGPATGTVNHMYRWSDVHVLME